MSKIENKTNILLVDDRQENLLALEAILEAPGLNILTASSGNKALGLMLEYDFAVVILDVQMPDMDGFEVAELMRKNEKTKYLPIIFVTAFSKEDTYIFKGYETGAVDYLFKPLNPVILKSKVNIFLELDRDKKELEESKKKIEKQNKQLKELSIRDALTHLYNRRYFQEILIREFSLVKRNHTELSCFMIDLDHFKEVNDAYGHTFGDFVLRRFSQWLEDAIRKTDILSRYGGEEFVLLLPHTNLEGAIVLAEKFRQKAEKYVYEKDGYSIHVTVSVGIATFKAHSPTSAAELVNFADQALYRAKAEGRNQVRIYNEEALIESGTIVEPTTTHLQNLKTQLKNIREKSTDITLTSLETLINRTAITTHSEDGKSKSIHQEYNQKILTTLELLAKRLKLSNSVYNTIHRTVRLHLLLKLLLGNESTYKAFLPNKERKVEDYERYHMILEELTQMFVIFSEERSILHQYLENLDSSRFNEKPQEKHLSLAIRLFSVLEAFAAFISPQASGTPLTPVQIIDELVKQTEKGLDPLLVAHLLELIYEKKILKVSKDNILEAKKKLQL